MAKIHERTKKLIFDKIEESIEIKLKLTSEINYKNTRLQLNPSISLRIHMKKKNITIRETINFQSNNIKLEKLT